MSIPPNNQGPGRPDDTLTVHDLACVTGLSEPVIRRLVSLDVIQPAGADRELRFRVEVVEHVRRVRRLHLELGVSWPSMPLVVELLDRIDELERRLDGC